MPSWRPVWADYEYGIHFSRSTDQGTTWSTDRVLEGKPSAPLPAGGAPRVAVEPGGAIVCAWSASDSNDHGSIHVTRSLDGGSTWSTIVRLADTRTESPSRYLTRLTHVAVGPRGDLGLVGTTSWRSDVVFFRGWFRP